MEATHKPTGSSLLAYDSGRDAQAWGESVDTNPYAPGPPGFNVFRYWWFMGWYDAYYEKRFGEAA